MSLKILSKEVDSFLKFVFFITIFTQKCYIKLFGKRNENNLKNEFDRKKLYLLVKRNGKLPNPKSIAMSSIVFNNPKPFRTLRTVF